jgi:uncharacterized repeat protein (TIGR03803 family)
MRFRRIFVTRTATLTLLALALFATCALAAPHETVLHSFVSEPWGSLIFDRAGNLYSTTAGGNGTFPFGTVFELTPKAGGGWTQKVLHIFGEGEDGQRPFSNLIFDAAGNLYGTTSYGGSGECRDSNGKGCGVVFELSPEGDENWTEKILYSFQGNDGSHPYSGVIFDAVGNLYGTTSTGGGDGQGCHFTGDAGCGTVFKLSPQTSGVWTETVLHTFNPNNGNDGSTPEAALIFDRFGNLYGTTSSGGIASCTFGCGTVFKLSPRAGGVWKETILHRFGQNAGDGAGPYGNLILDKEGKHLYGTTPDGGANNLGTVFELMPTTGEGWAEKVLYSFGPTDGSYPFAGVIFDAAGNLFGTTVQGPGASTSGAVFELSPTATGWTETVLHRFGQGTDGAQPYAGLVLDGSGSLLGTTIIGGVDNLGTVFKLTP